MTATTGRAVVEHGAPRPEQGEVGARRQGAAGQVHDRARG